MSLDPADPVWPSLVKSHILLLWIAAAGMPIAHAAFATRPAGVWMLYGPSVGVITHLLVINLVSWILPGGSGMWAALAVTSGLSMSLIVRSRLLGAPRVSLGWSAVVVVLMSVGTFVFLLANRTQTLFVDERWRLPLASILAAGSFPPVAAFTPDTGIGYHYGADLLAASLMNVTGVPSWTAFAIISPFIVTVMAITVGALARDLGVSRYLAVGVAAFAVLADRLLVVGLPQTLSTPGNGVEGLLQSFSRAAEVHPTERVATTLLNGPQFALAMVLAVVIAALLRCETSFIGYGLLAAATGLTPLAETSVFIAVWVALLVSVPVRLWQLNGPDRWKLFVALAVGGLLAAVAGGAVSDTLFDRGGSSGVVDIRFRAMLELYALVTPTGSFLSLTPGMPLVLVIGLVGALWVRSWTLVFLALTSVVSFGLYQLITVGEAGSDARFLGTTKTLASTTALIAIGALATRAGRMWAHLIAVGLLGFVVAPSVMPRAVSALQFAAEGIDLGYPTVRDPIHRHLNATDIAGSLKNDWWVYQWIRDNLSRDARILSPNPPILVAATGRVSPTSTTDMAVFDNVLTHTYIDALKYLGRESLEALGVTHLHVTSDVIKAMHPASLQALKRRDHFRLLYETVDVIGKTHHIYEVMPNAGQASVSSNSYAQFRRLALEAGSVLLTDAIPERQRLVLLLSMAKGVHMYGPATTFLARSSVRPVLEPWDGEIVPSMVVLPKWVIPTSLGLYADDSVWSGYGLKAYVTGQRWSVAHRVNPLLTQLSASGQGACSVQHGLPRQLRALGEPGSMLLVSSVGAVDSRVPLRGVPQLVELLGEECVDVRRIGQDGVVAPFVQVRGRSSNRLSDYVPSAGLGFDGGIDGDEAVINYWYRNPQGSPFTVGTELRLYKADVAAIGPAVEEPLKSIAWWPGPIILSVETQMGALQFDGQRLTLDGVLPSGSPVSLPDGSYLLALTLAGLPDGSDSLEIREIIPLLFFTNEQGLIRYTFLSGLIGLDP
jgi:hypothetical protein